ncbi:MAG: hypothetical protein RL021_1080 [Bacteroidota bacterium]|jgi:GNAT superfamily N-acetyltransferase
MIRQLSRSELQIVHDLAHEIWPLVYSKMISSEQMTFMLKWMYGLENLTAKFDQGSLFYTYQSDGLNIGYLHLEPVDAQLVKIQKVYVHPDHHGNGIGRDLLLFSEVTARQTGHNTLELQVNRGNPAVKFYQRVGFSIVDEQDFDIGNGYFMNDYVMRKKVE